MPKVSVIIPAYNEEKYIGKCLDSLLKQTYKDMEIIVIDDGSKDKTLEILKEYEKKYRNIRILTQEHKGPGEARNLGARKAKGEILVLVDADMEFDKDYVKKLVEPIINGVCVGTSHVQEYIGNEENIWARCWGKRKANPRKDLKRFGIFRAILKDKFLKTGGFNPKKGYFDDSSPYEKEKIVGLDIPDAICYHNNPSSLKEVFNHSKWIGGSLMVNYKNLLNLNFFLKKPERRKKFKLFVITSLIFILLFLFFIKNIIIVFGVLFLLYILILTLRRTIKEKEPLYLFTLPIFYAIKSLGLIFGALRQIPNMLIRKIQGKEISYKY